MNLGVDGTFMAYLNEQAPSLLYTVPLRHISFRWKIPRDELSSKWTTPKSGIDLIMDLYTEELCGYHGLHFPGEVIVDKLLREREGPYRPIQVFEEIEKLLAAHSEGFGEYREIFREQSILAEKHDCFLRVMGNHMSEPVILTRRNNPLHPLRIAH